MRNQILNNCILFLLLIVFCHNPAWAQSSYSGKVINGETGEPLAGAHVVVGTTEGVITEFDGSYTLATTISADSVTVSFIGFKSQTVALKQDIIIEMMPSAAEMNQVVVTANRERQERTDAPVAISVISTETINDTKPTTPRGVLNKVNGVYMVDLGNEQHSMSMRQPLSYRSLFLYLEDGIPIRPTGVYNHNALIEMNMAGTRRIEVVKGPSSSLHGSEAIGGAVNFITHRPSRKPVSELQMQVNNTSYKRADFLFSNTWNDVGLVASGYYANRANGSRDHSDYDKLALTVRGDWRISDQTKWNHSLSYINYETDMTGGVDKQNFASQNFSSLQTFTYRKVDAIRFRSTLEHFWNISSKTSITGLFRDNTIGQNPHYRIKDDYKPWKGMGDPSLAHGEENENSFQSLGIIAQHQQQFELLDIEWITGASVDYSPSDYNANYIRVHKNEDGIYTDYVKTDSLLTKYSTDLVNTAVYTHLKLTPVKNLNIIGALRYDRIDYSYDNHLKPTAFSGAPDEKNHFDQLTPKLGFTYDFGSNIGTYGNYSVGFSPPQISELYRGVKVPSLRPATYSNYELGSWFSFADGKGYLDIAFYKLKGKNEIVSVKQPDGSTEKENAGETEHKGIEYTVKLKPVDQLSFRFSGANAEHRFGEFVEKGNDYSDNLMSKAPSFIANSQITYRPTFLKGAHIGLEWQHLGEYYMDPGNTEKYPGFDVFNIRFGYEKGGIEIWAHTLNVSNKNYATVASKSAWGTSYRVGQPRTFTVGIRFNLIGKDNSQ